VAVRQCKTCTHWHLITTRHSMVRRIPSQVHKQAGRLLLSKFIRNEPVWYQAVLAYPPIPLPSRAPPSRSSYDTLPPEKCNQKLPKHRRYGTPQPLPIHYLEDDVRRQFFRDHPFEAFRPVTLAEAGGVADEHPIVGTAWTRLRQRGRNPSPEEYAYLFFLARHMFI
jgi:small subunit ribosomal protein S23